MKEKLNSLQALHDKTVKELTSQQSVHKDQIVKQKKQLKEADCSL
jgi:hypothetical protein